ncbi:MAG: non-homologous end-joining DNA ligase, partial [Tistlia sp.]
MSGLETYWKKRDFSKTAEPSGRKAKGPRAKGRKERSERFFIVQKHAATRLHYDFRLSIDGVLVSWAVTKGPSLDPSDKRLAVRTEDHPMDYADFEGTIPKREYGGGTVMLWDRGSYEVEGDPAEGVAEGKLKLALSGERLKGGFTLVRMRPKKGETRENWLLIKERDEQVDPGRDLGAEDSSVASGRSMAEIAEGAPARRPEASAASARPARAPAAAKPTASKAKTSVVKASKGQSRKGKGGKPPDFVPPQLATLVEEAPAGEGWLYETKFDGYRMLAACDGATVRCYTRSGADWSDRFGPIPEALAGLGLERTLLDGEIVVADAKGRSDFGALQRALKEAPSKLSYMVFDVLVLAGEDLRARPQRERKERLEAALDGVRKPVHLTTYLEDEGTRIAAVACREGHEGIIAKRTDAPYRTQRSRNWLKIKCVKRQEFVVGGWSPSGRGRPFSSLLLGYHEQGELRYAGKVGTGFDDALLDDLAGRMGKLARKTSPFAAVPAEARRGARWISPRLVAEVRYAEMTRDG